MKSFISMIFFGCLAIAVGYVFLGRVGNTYIPFWGMFFPTPLDTLQLVIIEETFDVEIAQIQFYLILLGFAGAIAGAIIGGRGSPATTQQIADDGVKSFDDYKAIGDCKKELMQKYRIKYSPLQGTYNYKKQSFREFENAVKYAEEHHS